MADGTLDIVFKVGEIVTIVGSVGVGLFTIGRSTSKVEASIRNQAVQLENMQTELKKLTDITVLQAVQTTRIDNLTQQYTMLSRTVEDLRRGNGFVRGSRPGVDGEYGA